MVVESGQREIEGERETERGMKSEGGTEKDAEIGRQCERERRRREKEILLDQTLTIGVVEREFKA